MEISATFQSIVRTISKILRSSCHGMFSLISVSHITGCHFKETDGSFATSSKTDYVTNSFLNLANVFKIAILEINLNGCFKKFIEIYFLK